MVLASSLYGTALLTTSTILPQMQGAMSATQDEIAWVMTFNILATAIVTPMTGWLVARFGEKRVMVWSIGVFTLATLLCGMSQSLETLVFWRIIQGGTGAPVVPLSQTILLNTFPRRQHPMVLGCSAWRSRSRRCSARSSAAIWPRPTAGAGRSTCWCRSASRR